MPLDSRFVATSDLESFFVDKDTGLPLAAGVITFYGDPLFTTLKPVYQLTLAGTDYQYAPLPNPCVLSGTGTFQDALGNNIVPYYFPYDGTPDTSTGVLELYFIRVQNSGGTQQFTRSAWPNVAQDTATVNEFVNYVPNGQFLAHNDIAANPYGSPAPIPAGRITQAITNIAQGGWEFEVPNPPTGTYDVTFTRFQPTVSLDVNAFPRYGVKIKCGAPGGDSFRKLRLKWNDVNQFNATNIGDAFKKLFKFFVNAESNDGGTYIVPIFVYKFYGTGSGTPDDQFQIGTMTISPTSFGGITINNIDFKTNSVPATTIGTVLNDDYIAIEFRFPTSTFEITITDVVLADNDISIAAYPETTNAQAMSQALAPSVPLGDGSNLYLPMIVTKSGVTYDDSIVGQIIGKPQLIAVKNELLMNGSVYRFKDYSPLGIPYSRLGNFLVTNTALPTVPMFGTGPDFLTVTSVVSPIFNILINIPAAPATVVAGTSGFIVVINIVNNSFTITVPGIPTTGQYFSFTTPSGLIYNVWYNVSNGGGSPAVPTGANIEVSLTGAETIATLISKTQIAINQYQFMVLNAAGYFWRGLGGVDPNAGTRTIPGIPGLAVGANLGSEQTDIFASHNHPGSFSPAGLGGNVLPFNFVLGHDAPGGQTAPVTVALQGGLETRPKNLALNWFIRY